ncbi:MAG: hypothetical protein HPY75_12000 [Actinobacteria bacterium]|nr:hypothetical protein [Actinomycetota bacterium]
MEDMAFSLGADEVGMSLILIDEQESARRYLLSVMGQIDADEMRGRLFAAYDTLMARGLAAWSEDKQKVVLDGSLEPLVQIIANPVFSIMATINNKVGRQNFLYHFGSDAIVQVRDRGLVGLELRPLEGPEAALAPMVASMGYPPSIAGKSYAVSMTLAQLNGARKMSREDPNAVSDFLTGIGMDEETAHALATDFSHEQSRGSVVRVDYVDDVAKTDRGFMTLGSAERGWIFRLHGDPKDTLMVDGTVATSAELEKALRELIS